MDRLSVPDAARKLKVTPDAIRQRIRRNSIEWEKDEAGKYYVLLDPDTIPIEPVADDVANAMVDRLQEENWYLRRELDRRAVELERRDAIMISLTEGLKAISPPNDFREPGEPIDKPDPTSGDQETPEMTRGFWRRFFGF